MSQKLPSFLYKKKLSPLAQEQELSCNAKDQPLGNIDIGVNYHTLTLSYCNKVFHFEVEKILDTIYIVITSFIEYYALTVMLVKPLINFKQYL